VAITRETVLHVARLARLELADDEVASFEESLGKILGYVEQLSELPSEGIAETSHVATEHAPLRADALIPSLNAEQALGEAPRQASGAFAVPGFVDE